MISIKPPGTNAYSTDSMEKKQPLMSKFKPQNALFRPFSDANDKENYPQQYHQQPIAPYHDSRPAVNFSLEGLYPRNPPPKRKLMDAAPIHESRPFKRTKLEDDGDDVFDMKELPPPDSFPVLHDDGTKPPHSYAQLIGMSILRAPNRRLTLAQIYKWISDTYSFYGASDAGWQNSIRHNLSLNKAFIKQERPKDDPGKGNYWAIQPGMEHQFIKDKNARKGNGPNENVPIMAATFLPSSSQPEIQQFKPMLPQPQELPPPPPQQSYALPDPQLPVIKEISSDATIPASDAFATDPAEPETEDANEPAPPSSPLMQSSPPTAMMRSSPPIPRQAPKRHDTPPPVPRFPSSSRSRSHQRKYASMDDSGYFSSLESSAMRPHRLLTSEADGPRIKRGRAEEEIARLRGSSFDSPTKGPRALFAPPSSSPVRRGFNDSSSMLPPLTPAVKLKAPVRPPPSISPNTNLRLHRDKVREMVGSPLRGMTCLDENLPWSPAFNLDDTSYMFQDFSVEFDIFADSTESLLTVPGTGSPEKKSARRPRLDRSRSANILADISQTPKLNKSITSTPLIKLTPSNGVSSIFNSPSKGGFFMESPSKLLGLNSPSKIASPSFGLNAFELPDGDFFGDEFLSEDVNEGWDIMAGFQRIGSGANGASGRANSPSKKPSPRPGMGRSFTSRF